MPDAATCPKCGAETGGTNPAYRFKAKWKCGSYIQSHGEGIFRQSNRCRISELERDLHAAREENAGLRELLKTSKYIGHWTDAEINAALARRKGEG